MKKMMEFVSYALPTIGSIAMVFQAKGIFLQLPYEQFGLMIITLLLVALSFVRWLRRVDESWLEKVFIMGIISSLFIFISGENSMAFLIIANSVGIIAGISTIYLKYKFSFINKKERQKYYPEKFDIGWYGWMLLPKGRSVKVGIISVLSRNFKVDIHSLSSYLGISLKRVLKNLAELKKEGKIDVNYRKGKTFVEVIKDEM